MTTALSVTMNQTFLVELRTLVILTASTEKSVRSVNFADSEKRQAYFVPTGEPWA